MPVPGRRTAAGRRGRSATPADAGRVRWRTRSAHPARFPPGEQESESAGPGGGRCRPGGPLLRTGRCHRGSGHVPQGSARPAVARTASNEAPARGRGTRRHDSRPVPPHVVPPSRWDGTGSTHPPDPPTGSLERCHFRPPGLRGIHADRRASSAVRRAAQTGSQPVASAVVAEFPSDQVGGASRPWGGPLSAGAVTGAPARLRAAEDRPPGAAATARGSTTPPDALSALRCPCDVRRSRHGPEGPCAGTHGFSGHLDAFQDDPVEPAASTDRHT